MQSSDELGPEHPLPDPEQAETRQKTVPGNNESNDNESQQDSSGQNRSNKNESQQDSSGNDGSKQNDAKQEMSEEEKRQRKRDNHILLIVAAVLGIGFLSFVLYSVVSRHHQNQAMAAEAKKEKSALPQVSVVKGNFVSQTTLTLPGNMQAINDTIIGARSTGYVRRWYVEIGQKVKAGQLLAEIESPEVDADALAARADTARSRAVVRQSQADVANKQATVVQYEANVRQAEADLAAAEANQATAEARYVEALKTVETRRAQLVQAEAQQELAQKTYARNKTLLQYGYVALQDVDQSQATYDTDRAAVKSAQADLAAEEAEADADAATVKSYARAVSAAAQTVASQRATVAAAQANVRLSVSNVVANQYAVGASTAAERRAAVLQHYEQVRAPFAGVITARNIDVGTLVNAGSGSADASTGGSGSGNGGSSGSSSASSVVNSGSAATSTSNPATAPGTGLYGIARTEILRILVDVPQTFAKQIHPGLATHILVQEFPAQTFPGEVYYVSGALDIQSRTLLTEVRIPNQNGLLLPGMYTQVQFDLPSPRPVLHIPANTLMFDSRGTRVATVTPDNKVHFVPVKLGRDFGKDLEITNGLNGQETLISDPTDNLQEGQAVHPITPSNAAPAQQKKPKKRA